MKHKDTLLRNLYIKRENASIYEKIPNSMLIRTTAKP